MRYPLSIASTSVTEIKKPCLNIKRSVAKPLATAVIATLALGAISNAQAKVLFSDTSVSLLYGEDYELEKDGELTRHR